MRSPLRSKRAITSPVRARWKASGFTRISVRLTGGAPLGSFGARRLRGGGARGCLLLAGGGGRVSLVFVRPGGGGGGGGAVWGGGGPLAGGGGGGARGGGRPRRLGRPPGAP